MPKFTVRGANMWANYVVGTYEAEDGPSAIEAARRDRRNVLVGLVLSAATPVSDRPDEEK